VHTNSATLFSHLVVGNLLSNACFGQLGTWVRGDNASFLAASFIIGFSGRVSDRRSYSLGKGLLRPRNTLYWYHGTHANVYVTRVDSSSPCFSTAVVTQWYLYKSQGDEASPSRRMSLEHVHPEIGTCFRCACAGTAKASLPTSTVHQASLQTCRVRNPTRCGRVARVTYAAIRDIPMNDSEKVPHANWGNFKYLVHCAHLYTLLTQPIFTTLILHN
jgi:hypothetical protein